MTAKVTSSLSACSYADKATSPAALVLWPLDLQLFSPVVVQACTTVHQLSGSTAFTCTMHPRALSVDTAAQEHSVCRNTTRCACSLLGAQERESRWSSALFVAANLRQGKITLAPLACGSGIHFFGSLTKYQHSHVAAVLSLSLSLCKIWQHKTGERGNEHN